MNAPDLMQNRIDATGLACPLPLLKLKQALHRMAANEQIVLLTSDPNSLNDIKRYCEISGHDFEIIQQQNQQFEFLIRKKSS